MNNTTQISKQNPRTLLQYPDGQQQLKELIQVNTRYVPQEEPLEILCSSLELCLPTLFEGHRGGGKTLGAESLADGCGLKKFLVPCSEATRAEELLYEWDRDAQNLHRNEEIAEGRLSREIRDELWTIDFLILGKVLDALNYAFHSDYPPVLIFDEIDKLSKGLQGTLLEILTAGFGTVARLKPDGKVGMLPGMDSKTRYLSYPIIIFTSNDTTGDKIIDPLRSRATYCPIKPPTGFELIKVLHSQVPQVSPELLKEMARLQKGIQIQPMKDRPALREYVNFLRSLMKKGERTISAKSIYKKTSFLAKNSNDFDLIQDKAEMLYKSYVSIPDGEIDSWVAKAIEEHRRAVTNVERKAHSAGQGRR